MPPSKLHQFACALAKVFRFTAPAPSAVFLGRCGPVYESATRFSFSKRWRWHQGMRRRRNRKADRKNGNTV